MAETASDAFVIAQATNAGSQGALVSLHTGVVDCTSTTSANTSEITGTGYARLTTTWGTPTTTGAGAPAVMTGSALLFTIPAGVTTDHFCVRTTAGVPLWSAALTPGVTIAAGGSSGQATVTPVYNSKFPAT